MHPEKPAGETAATSGAREGTGKIMPIETAVARYVRPGMSVHLGAIHSMPYAGSYALARALAGSAPGLTIITQGAVLHTLVLLHLGLVKKIVTTYCGDVYPAPGPSPVIGRALAAGQVTVEDWSLLTLTQRLMAGALGLPFVPARGLLGTTMAKDNPAWAETADPWGTGEPQGVVQALHPDLSIYHAWAADPEGNALFTGPYAEGVWGAMAAREGAIVTAERVISSAEVRRHAQLTLLPGRYVRAVCPAPFGAHPSGLSPHGYPDAEGYSEDYDFVVAFQEAAASEEALTAWVDEWVLGPETHAGYLARLGADRLHRLRGRAALDAWQHDLRRLLPEGPGDQPAGALERMILAAAAVIEETAVAKGYDTLLAGIGAANLAAWLAHHRLRHAGHAVDLVAEVGFVGYLPQPADPFIFNFSNIPTCTARLDALTALGVLVGGARSNCLGCLGAGQIDRFGNINSTAVPGLMRLVGSGGAADVANGAREVVVVLPMAPTRLVPAVPYVTAPGHRVTRVVTNRGVLERDKSGELRLTRLLGRPGRSEAELVAAARARCGWELQVADRLVTLPPPDPAALARLRRFDPRRAFIGEPGEPARGNGGSAS